MALMVVTPFGGWNVNKLPEDLRLRLEAARITKGGMPDRRYAATRTLWADIEAWAQAQYMAAA